MAGRTDMVGAQVGTSGIGGFLVAALVVAGMTAFARMLAWIVDGNRGDRGEE